MRVFPLLLSIFLFCGYFMPSAQSYESVLEQQFNTRLSKSFVSYKSASKDYLKSIGKNLYTVAHTSSVVAKTTASNGKDRAFGLSFCNLFIIPAREILYPHFQSFLIPSKDFILFRKILLYPKHSFW